MIIIKGLIRKIEWEGVLWFTALIYLCFVNPYQTQSFTFCLFHNLGIDFCPGCGLGRSISFLYYADIINSFKTHPFGILALLLISYRTAILAIKTYNNFHKTSEVVNGKRIRFNA